MSDTLHCPDCDKEIDSTEDLDTEQVPEVEGDEHSVSLFENRDLFLCKGCGKPLGVGRTSSSGSG